jgi:small-conductance mechanosensitive channel
MRGFLFGKISNLVENGIEAFPGLVTVLIILFLGRLLTQAIKQFFDGIESGRFPVPGVYAETAGATRRLVNALIWLLTLVIAYPYFPGSQSPAFKGVSVFVGLIFTLGSAGIVNHLMSGLVLVYSRAFKQGDFIRIGEVEGTVLEVGPLSVKLVTKKREELTIPNTVMTSSIVTNYTRLSKEEGLILSTSVTIGYDAPWRQVHELLKLAARRTSGLRKTPEPFVIQAALTDFYVDYRLCISPERPDDRIRVLSELHQNIQDAFNEYGVQILSPNFEAQPDHSVVVPKEKWFSAPAVRPDTKEEKES